MTHSIHLCRFDSTLDIRKPTYETVKQRVLEAGRYSCFEATENKTLARIFTRLERDPDLICTRVGFPWIKVEHKQAERKLEQEPTP